MRGTSTQHPRSGCPVNAALEIFGDRWSLLIIRDLMVRGYRSFGEFLGAGEGIATNILADRLRRLEAAALLTVEPAAGDSVRQCGGNSGIAEAANGHAATVEIRGVSASMAGAMSSTIPSICI